MTQTQRNLLTFGALGALFLAGSFLQSRGSQARGAYSTPVQVMNTSSAPVVGVDAEKLARIPYQSVQYTNSCSGITGCQMQFTPPPTGYRLVIEHVSGFFWQTPAVATPASFYLDVGITGVLFAPAQAVTSTDGNVGFSMLNQDALVYIDPGMGGLTGIAEGNWTSGLPVQVNLSGYLENCSITGCPAITH